MHHTNHCFLPYLSCSSAVESWGSRILYPNLAARPQGLVHLRKTAAPQFGYSQHFVVRPRDCQRRSLPFFSLTTITKMLARLAGLRVVSWRVSLSSFFPGPPGTSIPRSGKLIHLSPISRSDETGEIA